MTTTIPVAITRQADLSDEIGRMLNRLNELGYRGDLSDDTTERLEARIHAAAMEHLRGYPLDLYKKEVRAFYDYYTKKGVKR